MGNPEIEKSASDRKDILKYYDTDPAQEWLRTQGSYYSSIEFEILQKHIQEHIQEKSRILDIGCGAGRHAIALAQRGHYVSLVDISPMSLQFAVKKFTELGLEKQLLHSVCQPAEVLMLSEQEKYDAVLLFGPMYHLLNVLDRQKCFARAVSMVKPQGFLFATFITLFSVCKDFLKKGRFSEIGALLQTNYLEHGEYRPVSDKSRSDYMPPLKAFSSEEAVKLFEQHDMTVKKLVACESFAAFMRPYVEQAVDDLKIFGEMMEVLTATCQHSSLINSADHFLIVGQKSALSTAK